MNKGRVLIVDDDSDLRETLAIILSAEGYPVITADDGRAAQRCIESGETPSLIILDLMMPAMNGEQLLEWLSASGHGDLPVCVMSGRDASTTGSWTARAAAVLSKPVDLDVLLSTLARLDVTHSQPSNA